MGLGHAMRLLSLGQELIARGGHVTILGDLPSVLNERFRQAGIAVHELRGVAPGSADDCTTTINLLSSLSAQHGRSPWLVADGYSFTANFHEAVAQAGFRQLRYDDLADRPIGPVNVVVNQNAGAEHLPYPPAPNTAYLLGTRFATLRQDFVRDIRPPRNEERERNLLLTFGGSTLGRTAAQAALAALGGFAGPPLRVLLLAPPEWGIETEVEALQSVRPDIDVDVRWDVQDLPERMRRASLAICAASSTCWELAHCGTPMVVLTLAPNQEVVRRGLTAVDAAFDVGVVDQGMQSRLAESLSTLFADDERREALGQAAKSLVDGRGAERISTVLTALDATRIPDGLVTVRPADHRDLIALWRIANDPEVRRQSFGRPIIGLDEHRLWFDALLGNPSTTLLVFEIGGVVAAQVRYDHNDVGDTTVHFAVTPGFRGRGLGTRVLSQTFGHPQILRARRVRGLVLTPNRASAQSFQNAGYTLVGEATQRDQRCFVFERELTQT
jgi:spore coat polysaccharide biosynthesis predicted glycosyltransferase SpsG/RimJ/RimL family protein N-acetyltransferase